ncbi:MAG: ParB/RepB/Spo0J family partition protein [Candidatus Aminicenantes bacterium]|nr:ParB/RepB/Spo0J family partition protein [Candidatus Aminicenantes bacterium]
MQRTRKSGLPDEISMRHDYHYVDLISKRSTGPRIRMITIEKIDPNPRQPRNQLGDLTDLMASIKEKGVLEPILVRPIDGKYEIIAGERRFRASKKAGLKEIPCIEMDVKESEAMEISLIENVQRKDLDAFEEADGLRALAEIYGFSHQQVADKIGKSRSTITEIMNLSKIPYEIRQLCSEYNITSRTTLIEISKQKTSEDMQHLIIEIKERDLKREDTRELSKNIKGSETKIKRFVYNYRGVDPEYYKLRIEFKKQDIEKKDIIRILEDILIKLKK